MNVLDETQRVLLENKLFDLPLSCPEPGCGGECLHPVKVEVNAGGKITVINSKGTTLKEGKAAGRGVTIAIYFEGECGHVSMLYSQFHKGSTYQVFHSFGVLIEDSEYGYPITHTIWRD